MKNYDLGTEKIGRLVRHFSVPCVISMLVAALYNIVDQIFIGWSPAGACTIWGEVTALPSLLAETDEEEGG